jgi:catechol 2,3-dioxygenase-like lactoylglutathione lyase family enzyme
MIKRIGHTAFVVSNMEESCRFYSDVLGFKQIFELKRPETGEPWIVYLKVMEEQFIELFYGGEKSIETDITTIGYHHLCLEVEDIHTVANHLKESGITLDKEIKQGFDLNYQCWVSDPDGNRIEFMQYHPDCPQLKSYE